MTLSVRIAAGVVLLLLEAPALSGGVEVTRSMSSAAPARSRLRPAGALMALPGSVGHADGIVAARPLR